MVDDDVTAGFQPHFWTQAFVNFLLNAELFEDRGFLGVELHTAHELRLEAAHEVNDFGVLLFGIDPDGAEIGRDVVAKDAFDQVQIAVQDRGSLALFGAGFNFGPGAGEEFHVGADFIGSGAGSSGAHDETAA